MTNNSKYRDNGGRIIFENATLCSQFLREYTGLDLFKNLKPEDIEDMTERFLPMFSEERDSDVVKKVKLADKGEMFVIALIEHKSSVDYNVSMQLFHYMSYIWEEYERMMESTKKGIIKTKDFKYPPILPIVYYEDTAEWTSPVQLSDRVFLSEYFGGYLPDFRYFLFRLQEHGKSELIGRRDEISFIMLINRLRNAEEFRTIEFPDGYLDDISDKAPGDVLITFSKLITAYLRKINLSEQEISDMNEQIRGGKMNELFEHFQAIDIQAMRKEAAELKQETADLKQETVELKQKIDDLEKENTDSEGKGSGIYLITLVCKKLQKGKTVADIAEDLEEDETLIKAITDIAEKNMPDYDAEKIWEEYASVSGRLP